MTIKAGDLVQVVRCCCTDYLVGTTIFRVAAISKASNSLRCRFCKTDLPNVPRASVVPGEWGYPCTWLKKIPPLSDLEGQKDSSGLDERHEFYEALRKMAEGLRS